jgi:DNA excision repair protein ERCC-2
MAITLSKLFMRTISQNPNENQTGISLWNLEDVLKAQEKQKAFSLEVEQQHDETMDDEYEDGGLSDHLLGELEMDL